MNPDTINSFVQFYVQTFNDKTRSTDFMTIWKDYSICVYNGSTYTKETLADYLNTLYAYKIKCDSPNDIIVSSTINGKRRANILMSYKMIDEQENIKNVSQYLLLAYSNNKEFWVHTNITNIK